MLHGKAASQKAEKTASETFGTNGFSKDLPEIKININDLKLGIKLLDLLSSNKIVSSKSEARRAIQGKAIKIDDGILTDEKKVINLDDFKNNKFIKISFGKKKHYLLKII